MGSPFSTTARTAECRTNMTPGRKSIGPWLTACAKDAVNRFEIKRDLGVTDLALVRKIRSSLLWNRTTYWVRDAIDVGVEEGVAYLHGRVDTWIERAEAGRVATNTLGIWRVHNYLLVDQGTSAGTNGVTTTAIDSPTGADRP